MCTKIIFLLLNAFKYWKVFLNIGFVIYINYHCLIVITFVIVEKHVYVFGLYYRVNTTIMANASESTTAMFFSLLYNIYKKL